MKVEAEGEGYCRIAHEWLQSEAPSELLSLVRDVGEFSPLSQVYLVRRSDLPDEYDLILERVSREVEG